MSDLLEYKCPCCGGAVEFNSAVQRMKCPFCDTEFDIDELKAAQEDLGNTASEKETEVKSVDEATGMAVYVCQSCGGEIIGDGTTAASSCPYCGNPVVMKGQFSGDLRPDLVIPFKLDKKAAKEALKKHIGTKKFVPKIFKDENHIDEIKGVYVPEWLFSADVDADVVYKGQKVREWSDSEFDYVETSCYDLFRNGKFSVDGLPVDGSSKMDDTLMEAVEPFDIKDAVEFSTAYLAGYVADRYDVDSEQSKARAEERITQSAIDTFMKTTNGYENVSGIEDRTRIELKNSSCRYALYPVWLLNTSWKGEKFTFAMNGQTGKIVGDLPLDKNAFWKSVGVLTAILGSAIYAIAWLIAR
ncbi:MAG: hypothetical protein MJ168_12200 [Clostridia bacterium]|nr:hypothetical protein [Clostridia bacterium]